MSHYLRLSFRLFDGTFHGRGDGGEPEWPPSPLRAFQALVAAAGQRWRKDLLFDSYARDPLTWLEGLGSPEVIAPACVPASAAYRLYVPNNHADVVAAAWAGGDPLASIAEHRVEKDVRSIRLTGGDAVHYLWPVAPDQTEHVRVLNEIAREVSHLGWGIDQAAALVSIVTAADAKSLIGERWIPTEREGTPLRVPQPGGSATVSTLVDLRRKHTDFIARLGPEGFKPVPPLRAYRVVRYRRDTEPVPRSWVAFRITSADPDAPHNPSFNTSRRCRDVAAWVRHVTDTVCKEWPFGDVAAFVHGHAAADDSRPLSGDGADNRFMYLPLPSIERRGEQGTYVGSIRRVLIAAPAGCHDQIEWIRRRLPGQELMWDGRSVGMLAELPKTDWVLEQYTREGRVWSTVTPVVLHRHDVRGAEVRRLLLAAFHHAGFVEDVVSRLGLEYRNVGFRAGVDLAAQFVPADTMTGHRYHVRVCFPHPIRGPFAVGAGRYRGFGVFAIEGES